MKRIRMIRHYFGSPDEAIVYYLHPGQVVAVPEDFAEKLLKAGFAIEDKTLDGMMEIKKVQTGAPQPEISANKKRGRKVGGKNGSHNA